MMNPAELKELSAVLTGIADRKPWQMRSSENVEWGLASDCADPMDVIKAGFQIRLKPWELGRSINGHTLPDGASWHRQDFTEDMLPDRYRPLMDGENMTVGDEHGDKYMVGHDGPIEWRTCPGLLSTSCHMRTTRPIPFTLTKEQIADGWLPWSGGECPVEPESQPGVVFKNTLTFLSTYAKKWRWTHIGDCEDIIAYKPVPYGHLRQALADGKTVQIVDSERNWVDLASPGFDAPPYRYLIKEPQRLPLGPSDVPPGSVVRKSDWPEGTWEVVHGTEVTGINWDEGNEKFDSIMEDWQINRPRHRDADGNPTLWEPCRKQAP